MKSPEHVLVWLLRLAGAITLTALLAMLMPYDWMNVTHRWLGMGELPELPIIGYLTRSISALYALHGALLVFVSLDVRRYLPIIKFLGWANVVMGVLLFGIDRVEGMPSSWTFLEGPPVCAFGVVLLALASRVERQATVSPGR